MSDDKDFLIFAKELTHLYDECKRGDDLLIEEKITQDLTLLEDAIQLLSVENNLTLPRLKPQALHLTVRRVGF